LILCIGYCDEDDDDDDDDTTGTQNKHVFVQANSKTITTNI